ncbi:MAG: 50S ribosomal protein L17 [Candidatus Paceibacterota bacterium]
MRHHKTHRTLGRVSRQRKALLCSLARSLVLHDRIQTTEAKAKELRPFAEKLLTEAKKNTQASIRRVENKIGPDARVKLCGELASRYQEREGGYTRIVKLPYRKSDSASLAIIEFVE